MFLLCGYFLVLACGLINELLNSNEAGAIRELHEEIGVEIADPRVLKFLITRSVDGQEESVFAYVFETDGTPRVYKGERAE